MPACLNGAKQLLVPRVSVGLIWPCMGSSSFRVSVAASFPVVLSILADCNKATTSLSNKRKDSAAAGSDMSPDTVIATYNGEKVTSLRRARA
jgi:hypothetical protein